MPFGEFWAIGRGPINHYRASIYAQCNDVCFGAGQIGCGPRDALCQPWISSTFETHTCSCAARELFEEFSAPGNEIFLKVILDRLVTEPDGEDRRRQCFVVDPRLLNASNLGFETNARCPANHTFLAGTHLAEIGNPLFSLAA